MNLVILQAAGGFNFQNLAMPAMLLVFVVFFLILPQRKKQKETQKMQSDLKIGDKVVTSGGFHATVVDLDVDTITVELAKGTNARLDRVSINRVIPKV
jgi:preprotein translocase subunit YajC